MTGNRVLRPIDFVLRDGELLREAQAALRSRSTAAGDRELSLALAAETLDAREGLAGLAANPAIEAVVMRTGRPSYVIRNGRIELPAAGVWPSRLAGDLETLHRIAPSVGRVEVTGVPDFEWLGTAWLVGGRLAVTNRHVAQEFTTRNAAGQPVFASAPTGGVATARLDFLEEYGQTAPAQQVQVARVLYVAPDGSNHPDVAILELADAAGLPPALTLADRDAREGDGVGTIGYPAFDSRNGVDAIRDYFGEILDVKRFAPGMVMPADSALPFLLHDCTTLGGASGSPVFERRSGQVVGLHFAGSYLRANYAVRASALRRVVSDAVGRVVVGEAHRLSLAACTTPA